MNYLKNAHNNIIRLSLFCLPLPSRFADGKADIQTPEKSHFSLVN
jgi:hypothetical protein